MWLDGRIGWRGRRLLCLVELEVCGGTSLLFFGHCSIARRWWNTRLRAQFIA